MNLKLTPTERLVLMSLDAASPQTFNDLVASTGTAAKSSMRSALRCLQLHDLIQRTADSAYTLKEVL